MSSDITELVFDRLAVEQALSVRAAEDPAFRKALAEEPEAALRRLLGGKADLGDFEVEIVTMKPNRLRVTLPPEDDGEISDEELENVAGGTDGADGDMDSEIEQMNTQFLALENAPQMESTTFQILSNAAKARHDLAMNSIQNMRA